MRLHERVLIVQQAENAFLERWITITENYPDFDALSAVRDLGQAIANLSLGDKKQHTQFQREIEQALQEIDAQFHLTDGEKTQMLAERILLETKYLIRWERHGNTEKRGDEA